MPPERRTSFRSLPLKAQYRSLSTTILFCPGCRIEISLCFIGWKQVLHLDQCKCFVAVRNVSVSSTERHLAEGHRQTVRASGVQCGSGALRSTLGEACVLQDNYQQLSRRTPVPRVVRWNSATVLPGSGLEQLSGHVRLCLPSAKGIRRSQGSTAPDLLCDVSKQQVAWFGSEAT